MSVFPLEITGIFNSIALYVKTIGVDKQYVKKFVNNKKLQSHYFQ